MTTEYITEPQAARQINAIADTLGVERPYLQFSLTEDFPVLDRRKWRNWLDAVARVADQHGTIPASETVGQLSFDLGA